MTVLATFLVVVVNITHLLWLRNNYYPAKNK